MKNSKTFVNSFKSEARRRRSEAKRALFVHEIARRAVHPKYGCVLDLITPQSPLLLCLRPVLRRLPLRHLRSSAAAEHLLSPDKLKRSASASEECGRRDWTPTDAIGDAVRLSLHLNRWIR